MEQWYTLFLSCGSMENSNVERANDENMVERGKQPIKRERDRDRKSQTAWRNNNK